MSAISHLDAPHLTNTTLPDDVVDLLDGDAATARLLAAGLVITEARPEYLRHKPGETTIVSYRFSTPGGAADAHGYVHWCTATSRADDVHNKAMTLRPRMSEVGVSVVRVDEHTVFYGFPNDARLRSLRWFATPRKLKRVLSPLEQDGNPISKRTTTSTVLRYKPERRLVTRVDLGRRDGSTEPLLVRYATGRRAGQLADVATALLDNGVLTPTPRAQLHDGHVGVDDFIDGVELRTWLLDNGTVADELAGSLRRFHATTAPGNVPVRTEHDDLANAISGLSTLALWDEDLGRLAESVAARLSAALPDAHEVRGLIHGDLHDKNILVHDSRPWFIDLERAAIGAPASDLGRLRAHAISLGIRQPGWSPAALSHAEDVIDAYRSATPTGGAPIDDNTLGWHCAIALIDQALLVVRHVEDGWRHNAGSLLGAAAIALRPSNERHPRRHPHTQGAPRT